MTKDLFIDLNYRSGPSPSSCLHVHPNNELSNLMNNEHPITPPPELVEQWRNLPEYVSQLRTMFTVTITTEKLQDIATQAARWGYQQATEELETFLRKNNDAH